MRLLERRVIQAKTGERSGSEVLDDDVGLIDKAIDDATPVEPLEVEGDAFFVTIGAEEVGALSSHTRRPPRACLIAVSRTFYLDDSRPHVGEHHRAERAGQDSREIEDQNTTERTTLGHAGSILVRNNLGDIFGVRIRGEEERWSGPPFSCSCCGSLAHVCSSNNDTRPPDSRSSARFVGG